MLLKKCTAILAAGLMLANCATAPGEEEGFCSRNTGLCIVGGVLIVATVVVVAAAASGGFAAGSGFGSTSDERLKRDIKKVDTLPNGLQLYSFRYWNDDRTFVSVMAQDLLEDERFRHAVMEDEGGYYMVDLAALGLGIAGDAEQFFEAGRAAVAEARPVVN
jgi:hypothetical protein